jgi:hypothetical protein
MLQDITRWWSSQASVSTRTRFERLALPSGESTNAAVLPPTE